MQVILALLIAYAVAAFVRHDGDRFVDGPDIRKSSNGTFFWVHTFNLGKSKTRLNGSENNLALLLAACHAVKGLNFA